MQVEKRNHCKKEYFTWACDHRQPPHLAWSSEGATPRIEILTNHTSVCRCPGVGGLHEAHCDHNVPWQHVVRVPLIDGHSRNLVHLIYTFTYLSPQNLFQDYFYLIECTFPAVTKSISNQGYKPHVANSPLGPISCHTCLSIAMKMLPFEARNWKILDKSNRCFAYCQHCQLLQSLVQLYLGQKIHPDIKW